MYDALQLELPIEVTWRTIFKVLFHFKGKLNKSFVGFFADIVYRIKGQNENGAKKFPKYENKKFLPFSEVPQQLWENAVYVWCKVIVLCCPLKPKRKKVAKNRCLHLVLGEYHFFFRNKLYICSFKPTCCVLKNSAASIQQLKEVG